MAFLSEILGKPVTDLDGVSVGVLRDVIAVFKPELSHPVVAAVVVKENRKDEIIIPFSELAVLLAPAVPLNRHINDITPYVQTDQDIFLSRDVLDKQIIDTDDVRVVRVNDIELIRVNGSVVASNVDVGTMGLLRRIGLGKLSRDILNVFHRQPPRNFISWDDVELFSHEQYMRLRVPSSKLSELSPADMANIISDMNRAQTAKFLDSLDVEQLADTLEEVEEDFQVSLVENMSDERVADVLEEMSPDEAADLLAELPKERSEKLIELMEDDDAEDVRKLLAYEEDTAGGIMTTEFISIQPDLNAEQAIQVLRDSAEDAETIYYVYVTDPDGHLEGVFSLSDLILAKPEAPITEFMHKRVVTVNLEDSQEDVARVIARYNLMSVPVVDEFDVMQGIVTADDALDKIIPTAWKKRLPRYYR